MAKKMKEKENCHVKTNSVIQVTNYLKIGVMKTRDNDKGHMTHDS